MNAITNRVEWVIDRLITRLHRNYNRYLGIDNTIRLSRAVNLLIHGSSQRESQRLYRERLGELLDGNGALSGTLPRNLMRDGYAIDRSGTLPHIQDVLEQAAPLIEERGGLSREEALKTKKPLFYPLLRDGDLEKCPAFLDFILSSEVIATVAHYMGCIPLLSQTRPPGVRFMESNEAYNPNPGGPPVNSQMFHIDIHDRPVVYVILLLRDVPEEAGPWNVLPASSSSRAANLLNYQKRGEPYRVTDERMFKVVDRSEVFRFTGPAGSVMFIDSSRCFHFGSRNAVIPRYQMMYGFTTHCRGDLSELSRYPRQSHPVREGESELRRLVLRHPH